MRDKGYQKVEEQGKGHKSWKLTKSSSPMLLAMCHEQKKRRAPTLVTAML